MVSHDIDFLHSLFGKITAVHAQVVTTIPEKIKDDGAVIEVTGDDTSIINLRFANGAVGVLSSSAVALHSPRLRLEAYGSKGTVIYTMDNHWNSKIEIGNDGDATLYEMEGSLREPKNAIETLQNFDPDTVQMLGGWEKFKNSNAKAILAMALLCEDFLDSIRNNVPIQPSFKDGWEIQKVIHAVRKSSETGQWIEISN